MVLRKYRTCIFVNGCFWHGHNVSLTPSPSPKGEVNNYLLSEEEDMQMSMAAEEYSL